MGKTIQEILYQPQAWEKTIEAFAKQNTDILNYLQDYQGAELVLTGCGTSYYLPLIGAALYTKFTGLKARGVPASEIMLFPDTIFAKDTKYLLISISRSGKTPETLAATRYAKDVVGGGTLLISCTAGSEMSEISDLTIICPDAAEETKYMTKSFTSMLLGFQLMTAYKTGAKAFEEELLQLPQNGERLIDQYQSYLEQLAGDHDFTLYVYLGHGPLYGIATESMLKIKEMARTPAEAYHGMELMHGPKYAVDEKTLVTLLLSDTAKEQEISLLVKIKELGAKIIVVCDEALPEVTKIADYVIEMKSGLSEYARLILYMLVTQLYGYFRAVATGKELE